MEKFNDAKIVQLKDIYLMKESVMKVLYKHLAKDKPFYATYHHLSWLAKC
jgi:hypothetical protein